MIYHYCPNCGSSIEIREIERRARAYCPNCQTIHYEQLKIGAGAIIEKTGNLLLIQRTIEPFKGCWNLPAGYAEVDESPLETARREVWEETGLEVRITDLVNVYFFNDDPRGNGILIVYNCQMVGGTLEEREEGVNPTYFDPTRLPVNLAGGGHDQAVHAWRERTSHLSERGAATPGGSLGQVRDLVETASAPGHKKAVLT